MTYEYACEACGHQWEAEQSIKDPALKKCASCGKNKAKRLVSGGTGFLLKGGGWYADGYGSKAATTSTSSSETKDSSGTSAAPASKSDSAGESKPSAESKPAASTETKAASSEPAAKATPAASPPSKKAS